MCYIAVIYLVNFKIMFDSNNYNWVVIFSLIFSIGSFYLAVLVESQLAFFDLYGQFYELISIYN